MDRTLPYRLLIIQVKPRKFVNAYILTFDESSLSLDPFLGLAVGSNNMEPKCLLAINETIVVKNITIVE
jgi:hypothetical protein